MTGNEGTDATRRIRLVPDLLTPSGAAAEAPEEEPRPAHPMPRLGRGIVWSDIVAEMERDHRERTQDAA
jgi:hypothetical protein